MAILENLQVFVQQESAAQIWENLLEAESPDTIRDGATSSMLTTRVVEARPGAFRFLIVVNDAFAWHNNNGLEVVLTFNEGYEINHYKTFILKAGEEPQQLAKVCEADQMGYAPNADGCSTFVLQYVATPPVIGLSSDSKFSAWTETTFHFRKLPFEDYQQLPRRKSYTSQSELGRIKFQITPICVVKSKSRIKRSYDIKSNHDGQYELSKQAACDANLTLTTTLVKNSRQLSNEHYCMVKASDSAKYTFVFLYREAGMYERLNEEDIEIEENQTTKAQNKALQSRSSSVPSSPLFCEYADSDSSNTGDEEDAHDAIDNDDRTESNSFTAIDNPSPGSTPDLNKGRKPASIVIDSATPCGPPTAIYNPVNISSGGTPLILDTLSNRNCPLEIHRELSPILARLTNWVQIYNDNIKFEEVARAKRLSSDLAINNEKLSKVRAQLHDIRRQHKDIEKQLEVLRNSLAQLETEETYLLDVDEDLSQQLKGLDIRQKSSAILKPPKLGTIEELLHDELKQQQEIKDRNEKQRRRSKLSTDSTQDLKDADRAKRVGSFSNDSMSKS